MAKKWCMMFMLSAVFVTILLMLLNFIVDPFGVFGDRFFNWFSFDFTNNPRVAKFTYLDSHYKEYDSYIIGCSSTSSFPTEELNKYFNAKFYNMIMYGADMLDVEEECKYIIDNYNPKNILVNIYIMNGAIYDEEEDKITRNLHANVNGESKFIFYNRYLFLNPQYSFAKIRDSFKDTYLTQPFDVFNVEDGAYDKKVRDAEAIGNIENYYNAYPVFINYPKENIVLSEIDSTVNSIKNIRKMCEEKGVNLVFVSSPVYGEYFNNFSKEDVCNFYKSITEVTSFWDFSMSSISEEPRYFYDATHFRNAVGKMAIARMFNDDNVYYPNDFGFFVTEENVDEYLNGLWNVENDVNNYTKRVPVLMYHHIKIGADTSETITPELFEEHLKTIKKNGYTPVSIKDLLNYVDKGDELPDKPVIITFDDGYYSNYEYAFPLLQKYDAKAIFFAVGSSVGSKEFYKNTNYPITPHYSYKEALEMESSGIIDIQSHTYDMHQWPAYESGDLIRETAVRLENESEEEFVEALRNDVMLMNRAFDENLNKKAIALAFPHGIHDSLTDVILREEEIKVTFSTNVGNNTIIKGLPQSLYSLNRYNMCQEVSCEQLIEFLEKE